LCDFIHTSEVNIYTKCHINPNWFLQHIIWEPLIQNLKWNCM